MANYGGYPTSHLIISAQMEKIGVKRIVDSEGKKGMTIDGLVDGHKIVEHYPHLANSEDSLPASKRQSPLHAVRETMKSPRGFPNTHKTPVVLLTLKSTPSTLATPPTVTVIVVASSMVSVRV